jgi:hypothetical protein
MLLVVCQENKWLHKNFKKIKRKKFNEGVTDLYNENYKTLKKETKQIPRWRLEGGSKKHAS